MVCRVCCRKVENLVFDAVFDDRERSLISAMNPAWLDGCGICENCIDSFRIDALRSAEAADGDGNSASYVSYVLNRDQTARWNDASNQAVEIHKQILNRLIRPGDRRWIVFDSDENAIANSDSYTL